MPNNPSGLRGTTPLARNMLSVFRTVLRANRFTPAYDSSTATQYNNVILPGTQALLAGSETPAALIAALQADHDKTFGG